MGISTTVAADPRCSRLRKSDGPVVLYLFGNEMGRAHGAAIHRETAAPDRVASCFVRIVFAHNVMVAPNG